MDLENMTQETEAKREEPFLVFSDSSAEELTMGKSNMRTSSADNTENILQRGVGGWVGLRAAATPPHPCPTH